MRVATHIALELHDGEPVPRGIVVMHLCDNPPCCEPTHLKRGTKVENESDKVSKGRQARGERQGHARLTEAQVLQIRARRAAGEELKTIAADYSVTRAAISLVALRRNWKHVDGGER
jgi:hypothetical protein